VQNAVVLTIFPRGYTQHYLFFPEKNRQMNTARNKVKSNGLN